MNTKKFYIITTAVTLLIITVVVLLLTGRCGEDEPGIIDVKFYMNDGTSDVFTVISGIPGETEFVPDSNPERDGYSFSGWYLEPDGRTFYSDGDLTVFPDTTESFNVFAVWNELLSVDFFAEFLEIPTIFVEKNSLIEEPNVPEREGYWLDGWYMDSNYSIIWDFKHDRVFDDTTLYARWIPDEPEVLFSVVFVTNGGSPVEPILDIPPDSLIEKPLDPKRDDDIFEGWFRDQAFTERWNFALDLVTEDIVLYAKWGVVETTQDTNQDTNQGATFTVHFNSNGGTAVNAQRNVALNALVKEPANPTRAGHTFAGWFTDSNLTNRWNFATGKVTRDMTLFAKWDTAQTFTVRFDSRGGSAVNSQNVQMNGLVTRPTNPTRTGHTFAGWFTNSNITGNAWNFGTSRVTGDMTLFAGWTVNAQTFTVTFDPNNGGGDSTVTVNAGATVSPPSVSRENHTLLGWWHGSEQWNFANPVNSNIRLTARWEQNVIVTGDND